MTTALEGVSGQQLAPAALYFWERDGTRFIGGCVGPRHGMDGQKISSEPGFGSGQSSLQSVAKPTELTDQSYQFYLVSQTYLHQLARCHILYIV